MKNPSCFATWQHVLRSYAITIADNNQTATANRLVTHEYRIMTVMPSDRFEMTLQLRKHEFALEHRVWLSQAASIQCLLPDSQQGSLEEALNRSLSLMYIASRKKKQRGGSAPLIYPNIGGCHGGKKCG